MSHALVVGGTGMLRAVTLSLADRFDAVSVVARPGPRLAALEGGRPGVIHGLPVDWRDAEALHARLQSAAAAQHGPFDLALVWVHENAPEAPLQVAEHCAADGLFLHVLGSAAADPTLPERSLRSTLAAQFPQLRFQEVVLGFVREDGGSRWLTNEEISGGVLRAIGSDEERSIVGVVRPWSEKP